MDEPRTQTRPAPAEDWTPPQRSGLRYAVIAGATLVVAVILFTSAAARLFTPVETESGATVGGSLERIDRGAEEAFETRPPAIDPQPQQDTDAARIPPARAVPELEPAPNIKPYIPKD